MNWWKTNTDRVVRGCSPLEREVVYTLRCSSDVFANCFILACLHAEICSTIAPYLNHSLCRWCLVVTRIQQAAGLNELKPRQSPAFRCQRLPGDVQAVWHHLYPTHSSADHQQEDAGQAAHHTGGRPVRPQGIRPQSSTRADTPHPRP